MLKRLLLIAALCPSNAWTGGVDYKFTIDMGNKELFSLDMTIEPQGGKTDRSYKKTHPFK